MRHSKRDIILDAIVDLIHDGGIKAITYDAVSERTQITRGGLLYHFPSRDDLVFGVHKHLCERWEKSMAEAAAAPADQLTDQDKTRAYIQGTTSASRAEMILLLESAMDTAVQDLWQEVIDDWSPPLPDPDDPAALDLFLVRLAADGLWVSEALDNNPLPKPLKDALMLRFEEVIAKAGT